MFEHYFDIYTVCFSICVCIAKAQAKLAKNCLAPSELDTKRVVQKFK